MGWKESQNSVINKMQQAASLLQEALHIQNTYINTIDLEEFESVRYSELYNAYRDCREALDKINV